MPTTTNTSRPNDPDDPPNPTTRSTVDPVAADGAVGGGAAATLVRILVIVISCSPCEEAAARTIIFCRDDGFLDERCGRAAHERCTASSRPDSMATFVAGRDLP